MSNLSFRLFGPFEVVYNGERLAHFRTLKVQALLAYLVARPPAAYPREALMALLWPELPPASAQTNLRQIAYQLRKAIPTADSRDGEGRVPFLLSERQTVGVNPDARFAVDALTFDERMASVRRHEHASIAGCPLCRNRLEEAAALYRGTFLADLYLEDSNEFEDWAHGRRGAYRNQVGDALTTLGESYLRGREYAQAQSVARRQLEMDDLDERAYRQLMEALARDGRRHEAAAVYETARRLLREEIGMSPSTQTARLAAQIEAGELGAESAIAPEPPPAVRGYRLMDELGTGQFGRVYRAYQPVVGREVAIKVIRPRYANHPDFIRRFEAEAQTIARLEHPHIVPLYDYWREPDNAYLVMRRLTGGSLEAWLAGGPVPAATAAGLIDQIAAALGVAHRRGVIHRDVKPANILLDEDRNAYLSDFSLAKDIIDGDDPLALSNSPASISPEQLLREPLSPQSDQYSLAVVLYRMLTGRAPFPADEPPAVTRRRILAEPLPSAAERTPGLPGAADDVLRRATAKSPADRYPDVGAFAAAFRRALDQSAPFVAAPAITAAIKPAEPPPNPYKGLRAFEETDAATYFGREALVRRLIDRLAEDGGTAAGRFLAVVGPSGGGKSSLVKAGLIPALRRGAVPGSEGWFITEMTPGRSPLDELAVALRRVAVDPPDDLPEALRHDEMGLARVLDRVLPHDEGGAPPQLLLVIDQFEELFTLTPDDSTRRRFIDSLRAALDEPDARLRLIVTLRADFYDRPLEMPGLGEMLRDRTAVVLPMSRGELEAAITRPAAVVGVVPEPRLLAVMMADAADQPGSLPLVQYALTELFERAEDGVMTLAAYEAIGGVAGALGRRADEIMEGLDPAGQEAARQMFLRLVTLGEGVEDTRRRVLRAELEALGIAGEQGRKGAGEKGSNEERESAPAPLLPGAPAPVSESPLATSLDAFGRARLLTFDRDPATRGPTVEVAHEALLREWPRLRGWLDASRADLRMQRLLTAESAEWLAAGRGDGYLLRGSRLDQFEGWLEAPKVSLTADERAFLSASYEARNRRRADEEARRQRELDTARQLAETERQRAEEQAANSQKLRRRAGLLGVALAAAGLLALVAVLFARSSGENATLAATRAAEANANAALAVENANVAATRQMEAVAESGLRATAESEANVQRDTALTREREALESYSLSLAANARQALDGGDQPLALLLALAANTVENPPLDAWRTLLDVAYAPGAIREFKVGSPAFTLDVSPDGDTLVTGSDDGRLRIWDVDSGELLQTLTGHGSSVYSNAFSPDGTKMLSGDGDGTIFLWDIASGRIEHELVAHHNDIVGMAFLPDGRRAISGEDAWELPGELVVWDLETGESIRRFGVLDEQVEGVRTLAVSPDGRTTLVGYGSDSALDTHPAAIWDIETGELVRFLGGTDQSINGVAITPDGTLGLGASADSNIYVWDMATGELKQTLRGHETGLISIAVSPNGITVLSGSSDGMLIHWELSNGQLIERYRDHQQFIWRVNFLNDSTAATASNDGTARLWDLTGRWRQAQWRDPDMPADHQVSAIQISRDGRFALTQTWQLGTGLNPRLTLWDYESGQPIRQLERVDSLARDLAFMPDGRRVLTGHDDGTLILWDLGSGQAIRRMEGHREAIYTVDVSSDGRHAVSAGQFPEVLYWDLESGEVIHRMIGHLNAQPANDVRFLPGDRQAVSGASDGTMVIWDLATGEQIRRLTGLEGAAGSHRPAPGVFAAVTMVMPDSDGRHVLSAGTDSTLLLWDLETGHSTRRFVGHANSVISAALFPDGRWAVTGAPRDPMFLWDVATGKPIRRFPFLSYPGFNFAPLIAVHPDGRTVLTDDVDGSIVKWLLAEPQPTELVDWIEANRALRELTCLERETYRIEPLCVAGEFVETSSDMLATVRRATAALDNAPAAPQEVSAGDGPADMKLPERAPMVAVLGQNRGELARGDFDIWTYEGRAGEVITVHMVADRPLTDRTVPLDELFEAGVLDTDLAIIGPNGRLMDFVNDETTVDLQRRSDARIIAVRLPEDGSYRIEARSALDDQAGPYTLIIEQLPTVWYPDIYEEYVGHYLDGPWQWDAMIYMEDGRLYYRYAFPGSNRVEMVPLNETEFATGNTSITRMVRDESGAVSGYEVLYGYEHQRGGQWYQGERIGDLPPEFLEALEANRP